MRSFCRGMSDARHPRSGYGLSALQRSEIEPRMLRAVTQPSAMSSDSAASTIDTGTMTYRSGLLREMAFMAMPSVK